MVVGKAWWQEWEVAGHIVFAARNQRVIGVAAQLSFIFYLEPDDEIVMPTFRAGLPTLINLI